MADLDFTKRHPNGPRSLASKMVEVDLDEGKFHLPGVDQPLDLVGIKPDDLREKREAFMKLRAQVLRDMRSEWQCTQCKKTTMGHNVRVVIRSGAEVLVCPDRKCDGPMVRIRDAGGPQVVLR
jgi:hypothetical protein